MRAELATRNVAGIFSETAHIVMSRFFLILFAGKDSLALIALEILRFRIMETHSCLHKQK